MEANLQKGKTVDSKLSNPEKDFSIKYLMDHLSEVYSFDRETVGICVTAAFHYLNDEHRANGIDKVIKIISTKETDNRKDSAIYLKKAIDKEKMPRKENRVLRFKSAFELPESD